MHEMATLTLPRFIPVEHTMTGKFPHFELLRREAYIVEVQVL